jgi:hypothetical protein
MKAYWSDEKNLTPPASICHDLDRDALVFSISGVEVMALHRDGTVTLWGRRYCGEAVSAAQLFDVLHEFCTAAKQSTARELQSRLRDWCGRFGSELIPAGADSYGEGVRDSKAAVARILDRYGRD